MRTYLLLLVAALVCACGDDEPSAALAPSGGGPHRIGTHRPDAGEMLDDDDAGSKPDSGGAEGPAPNECVRLEALRYTSDELPAVTATSSPSDFLVTRQAATWRDDCSQLVIELSSGACPSGNGHELEIALSVNAIHNGQLGFGLNFVEAEPTDVEGMRVRYTRPRRYTPEGVYGSCEGSNGTISFYDAPDLTRPMNLRASYEFTLTPCDDTRNPAQVVSGFFDVRVRRTPATACP